MGSVTPLLTTSTPTLFPPLSSISPSKTLLFGTLILRRNSHFLSSPLITTNAANPTFSAAASRTKRSGLGATTVDSDADDDEDDDAEPLPPLEEMRRWELNKPAGFGEGKVYDTTVEEKILEEMEKARIAQLAEKKKEKEIVSNSKKGLGFKKQEMQTMDVISSGTHVRLSNLPKKRNIHRDLQNAFKGFSGIVNLSPAVIGNRKTRDPISKGFAFLELESKEAANRFVKTYSNQNILFGKIQKQISCDVIKSGQLVDDTQRFTEPNLTNLEDETTHEGSVDTIIVDKTKEESMIVGDGTEDLLLDTEDREPGIEQSNGSSVCDIENLSPSNKDTHLDTSMPSLQKQRKQSTSKKKIVRTKSAKVSKLGLPSSMARLKMQERTVLTGVFSKYGGKVASASDQ